MEEIWEPCSCKDFQVGDKVSYSNPPSEYSTLNIIFVTEDKFGYITKGGQDPIAHLKDAFIDYKWRVVREIPYDPTQSGDDDDCI